MMKIAGFKCTEVDDGEETIKTTEEPAIDTICGVDISWPSFEKDGNTFSAMIVLGNEDSELVSDYSCNNSEASKEFERVVSSHCALYE